MVLIEEIRDSCSCKNLAFSETVFPSWKFVHFIAFNLLLHKNRNQPISWQLIRPKQNSIKISELPDRFCIPLLFLLQFRNQSLKLRSLCPISFKHFEVQVWAKFLVCFCSSVRFVANTANLPELLLLWHAKLLLIFWFS